MLPLNPDNLNLLTGVDLSNLPDGSHSDGGGLSLRLWRGNAKWIYRYRRGGEAQTLTLGDLDAMTLDQARECRDKYFADLDTQGEPVDPKRVFAELRGRAVARSDAAPEAPRKLDPKWACRLLMPDGRYVKVTHKLLRMIEADQHTARCEWSTTRAADPAKVFVAIKGPKYWTNILVDRIGPDMTLTDLM